MKAVLQIVDTATVYADGALRGCIGKGLYILLGVAKNDTEADASVLAEKISKLRIFKDDNDKMNLSLLDVCGEAMIVPNFTLNANYAHGNRPDYFDGAAPAVAAPLYEKFVVLLSSKLTHTVTGKFGSDMRTEMTTLGPTTIILDSKVLLGAKNDTSH